MLSRNDLTGTSHLDADAQGLAGCTLAHDMPSLMPLQVWKELVKVQGEVDAGGKQDCRIDEAVFIPWPIFKKTAGREAQS